MTRDEFMKLPKHMRPRVPLETTLRWAMRSRDEWTDALTTEGWTRMYTMTDAELGYSEGWRREVGGEVEWFELTDETGKGDWDHMIPDVPREQRWWGTPSPRDPRIDIAADSC